MLKYLNIAYHDVENTIVSEVDEKYFYDIWTTDIVTWQNEYIYEESSSTQLWFKKMISVSVKYDATDDNYTKVQPFSTELSTFSRDRLADFTNTSEPYYEVNDSSLWIYPSPKNDVTDWLKVSTITNMIDLVVWEWEETIFPDHTELRQRHYVISMWIVPWILGKRWQIWEKNNAISEYEKWKRDMVLQLQERIDAPIPGILPSPLYRTR